MLIFKKMKLVECTEEEAERILEIYNHASCMRNAADKLYYEFVYHRFPYKAESSRLSTTVVFEMAYNAILAVINRYKYLKIQPSEPKCPLGGDESDDCKDCIYAGDYHFKDGECVKRKASTKPKGSKKVGTWLRQKKGGGKPKEI